MSLTTDQAYLIGLLIGGGNLSNQSLSISLPYKSWGDYTLHPQRGGTIAQDILERIRPIWKHSYQIDISYHPKKTSWEITSPTISQMLLDDLNRFGLPTVGEFREYAQLNKFSNYLDNPEKIKHFLAGLTDTIGSVAKSHRRFSDKFQIVSYEFKGKNFILVRQLYDLFKHIGCIPDQILWNHPNQHSGYDRYYKSWKRI